MDRKIDVNDKIDQVVSRLREDAAQLFDTKLTFSSDAKCRVLTTIDDKVSIFVSDNNYKEGAYTLYSKSKSSHKLCVIIYDELDNNLHSQNNPDNIPTLYISDVEDDSFLDRIKIYFEVVSEGKNIPSFKQIQAETTERIKLEYIKNNSLRVHVRKATKMWTKYITFNKIYKKWSDQELEQAWWEKNILDATMTTQRSNTQDKTDTNVGGIFKPTFIFDTSDGKKECYPDLDELLKSKDSGLDEYVFNRYQEIDIAYVRRIFLEFLLFMKSNKFEKPKMLLQLLNLIEQEISGLRKVNNNLIDLDISKSIHRYIEIIYIYYDAFKNDQDFLKNKIVFVKTYIKHLINDQKFRWLIDVAEYLMLYKKITKDYFEDEVSTLIEQLESRQETSESSTDVYLLEPCIKTIQSLKEYKGMEYNAEEKLAEIQYKRAHQAMSKGSYLYGTVLLKKGIEILEEAKLKGIYKEKIKSWSNILQKWAPQAQKELKPIPSKVPISSELTKRIEAAINSYITQLKKLSLKNRILTFFVHNTYFIGEEEFLKGYENYEQTDVMSRIEVTLLRGNNITASNEEEMRREQKEFIYYSMIIGDQVENFASIFDKAIGKLFTINDLIDYLNNSEAVHPDDLKFIKCGLELFDLKQYAASVHILLPVIERFFRMLMEVMGKDAKPKSGGNIERNISLDTMIKDSIEVGFPKDAARFFRFFISNKFGYNLRNDVIHSLHEFEVVNYRKNAILVLWCVLFCYVNLKRID